jgi:hypothetical protein
MAELRELEDRILALETRVSLQDETIRMFFIHKSEKSYMKPVVRMGRLSKATLGGSILLGAVNLLRFLLDMFLA